MNARAALAAAGIATAACAQTLTALVPRGAQRGTAVELSCFGRALDDTVSVLTFRPGITVEEIAERRADRVRLALRVADDCPLGAHPLLLHTARGITRIETFQVGALPEVAEVEPDDAPEQAQLLADGVTVEARIDGADVDWYAIDAAAGETWTFEIDAVRLGEDALDPYLELFDAAGTRLAAADDSVLGRLDPVLRHAFAAAGRYHVAVRDGAWRAGRYSRYRLHAGRLPRPTGLFPAAGAPGTEIEARWLGDGEHTETIRLPADGRGLHWHFPTRDGRTAPSPLPIRLSALPVVVEGEPGEGDEPPKPPFALHGMLAEPGEIDRFRFAAAKGESWTVRSIARALRSPADTVIVVRDAANRAVVSSDDAGGPDARLRFRPPGDGVYTLQVYDFERRGGDDFHYRIELTPEGETAWCGEAVPGGRPEDFGIAVPRGGRNATVFTSAGVGPGARLALSDLPPGVTVHAAPLAAGSAAMVIVFEAAGDAGLAACAAAVDCGAGPGDLGFVHGLPLVRVENNAVYYQIAMRSYPVAVVDPVPFAIDVEVPAVPLIAGSVLRYPLQVHKDEGFSAGLALRLYPALPGLTATPRRVGDDVVLELTARSNAPAQRWQAAAVATATVGGVARSASSALFEVRVEEPWVAAELGRARGEPGQKPELAVELRHRVAFAGEAVAELRGLPRGVTAAPVRFAAGTERIVFELSIAADAGPTRHRSHLLELAVPSEHGDVLHRFRGGEIRVDRPLAGAAAGEGGGS